MGRIRLHRFVGGTASFVVAAAHGSDSNRDREQSIPDISAGFFDPGFGHRAAGGQGARAVLELRSRDVPLIIEDGQIVGRQVYESMAARPEALYGADLKSNYRGQALKLSKHFKG